MTDRIPRLLIRQLKEEENIPYELLLLADETMDAINKYIHASEIYIAEQNHKVIAVYVLYPINTEIAEIKNIAVDEAYQNQGIGKLLLKDADKRAEQHNYKELIIGTPDTAEKQISIYQKAGFKITGIKKDFFIINYPEPIIEDGVALRDMVMLSKQI